MLFLWFYRCVNSSESLKNFTYLKPLSFGLYSVCEWFTGVYISIKSTKIKFIPILPKQMAAIQIFQSVIPDMVRPLVKSAYQKNYFLFLNQNICCGYSKEPSQWDGSFEHPKHMLQLTGKKILKILRRFFIV